MTNFFRPLLTAVLALALVATACGSSDETDSSSTSTTQDPTDTETTAEAESDTADTTDTATSPGPEPTETEGSADTEPSLDTDPMTYFVDGALTSDVEVVSCTLENGSETSCYQLESSSLPSTVDSDGPYCPETPGDAAGIWVWDGDEPGLYALDADFWAMMAAQGFDFVDADGNISITDPGAGSGKLERNHKLVPRGNTRWFVPHSGPVTSCTGRS